MGLGLGLKGEELNSLRYGKVRTRSPYRSLYRRTMGLLQLLLVCSM